MCPTNTFHDLVDVFLMNIENAGKLHSTDPGHSILRVGPTDYANLERVEFRRPDAFTAVERPIANLVLLVLFRCAPRQIRERVIVDAVRAVTDNITIWPRANKGSQNK